MDASAIMGAVGALKTAYDVAATVVGIRDSAKLQVAAIELQSKISSAQRELLTALSVQMEMLEKIRGLEAQIKAVEDWDRIESQYRLTALRDGVLVYRGCADESLPQHDLCPTCFQNKKKSILQNTSNHSSAKKCFQCDTILVSEDFRIRPPATIRTSGPRYNPYSWR